MPSKEEWSVLATELIPYIEKEQVLDHLPFKERETIMMDQLKLTKENNPYFQEKASMWNIQTIGGRKQEADLSVISEEDKANESSKLPISSKASSDKSDEHHEFSFRMRGSSKSHMTHGLSASHEVTSSRNVSQRSESIIWKALSEETKDGIHTSVNSNTGASEISEHLMDPSSTGQTN